MEIVVKTYLDYFKEICAIPHGSGNTKMISDYLVKFAVNHNLTYYQDEANNVIIIREASKGMEDAEPVIIQGHMDMVAVHDDDVDIDMTKEGLTLCEDGDFIYAKGTSLGGDDGIAVAYALALLEDTTHSFPRLEVLITVDEEVGMLGADVVDTSMLKGHTLLNIDSEEEGYFLVSCAGGARVDFDFPMTLSEVEEGTAYKISISNLLGGHSGAEIHKGHANAIELLGQILKKLSDSKLLLAYGNIKGGDADNVIANSAEALILSKTIEPELFEIIKFEVLEQFISIETNANVTLTEVPKEGVKWYQNNDASFAHFITTLPNGVMAMSHDIEGLVETSLNKGVISMGEDGIKLSISVRSSIDEKKQELIDSLIAIAKAHNTETAIRGDYPGWSFRQDSPIRDKMIRVYSDMYGKEPVIQAIHAGLECGLFCSKIKDLDCVSFGPDMYAIHSTKERLSLSSSERTFQFLVKVLETK